MGIAGNCNPGKEGPAKGLFMSLMVIMVPENTCARLYTTAKKEKQHENIAFWAAFLEKNMVFSIKNRKKLHIRFIYGLHFFRIYAILR